MLTGLDKVPVCVAYDVDGVRHDEMPVNQTDFHHAIADLRGAARLVGGHLRVPHLRRAAENAQRYVLRVEELIGARVSAIGVGPGRDEIIERHPLSPQHTR